MIGKLPEKILESLLETIPIEFSVVDVENKVVGWNKHEKRIFKRPSEVLGKDVRECHPENTINSVDKILREMKRGIRNNAKFWVDTQMGESKQKHKILIQFLALRDSDGRYIGCVETTQDIANIQKIKGEKRLDDA